jgi:hypothetical protein
MKTLDVLKNVYASNSVIFEGLAGQRNLDAIIGFVNDNAKGIRTQVKELDRPLIADELAVLVLVTTFAEVANKWCNTEPDKVLGTIGSWILATATNAYEAYKQSMEGKATPNLAMCQAFVMGAKDTTSLQSNALTMLVVMESIEAGLAVQRYNKLIDDSIDLHKRKNHDYGDSYANTVKEFGYVVMMVRLYDKYSRYMMWCSKDMQVDEKITDTLQDLANYSMMNLGYLTKTSVADCMNALKKASITDELDADLHAMLMSTYRGAMDELADIRKLIDTYGETPDMTKISTLLSKLSETALLLIVKLNDSK